MRNVLFVAPFSFETTGRFITAAAANPDTRLVLLTQDPLEKFPPPIRDRVGGHWQLRNALDPGEIAVAVEAVRQRLGPIHRLLGTLEHLQEQLAEVRERLSIEGMGVEAARRFRDKSLMKTVLREAGVPCARHRLITSAADADAFVDVIGFPVVVKPPDGAGARATYAVHDEPTLRDVLRRHPPSPGQPLLGEELIVGSEHSFDGVSIDGKLVWHSLTHYRPAPLEVVKNPWIQWCVLLPREIDVREYDDVRRVAARSLDVLGMETGVCHLEWFRRQDGSIAVSEVGARPGGAQITKLISYAHDVDFYHAWARVMIDGVFDPPGREYAAGAAYLRGQGEGRVRKIHGLEEAQREIGSLVVESNLPRLWQSPSGSYEGEGYVILRHRETEVVERALKRLITLVRVELG